MNEFAQAAPASIARPELIGKEMVNKIGRMLENRGKITRDEFKAIIAVQNEQDLRFGDAALLLGLVQNDDIKSVLAEQFSYTTPPDRDSGLDSRLIAAFQPDSVQTEALRSLRSELLLRYFNRGSHLSLAIVGSEDESGIATTASNLAITFSQLGIRTLLVDANLRSPQLQTLFGHNERSAGLSDFIADRVQVQPTAIPSLGSLWVLTAGTQAPNPQELLASKHYAEKLQILTNEFEVTIINTPPLTDVKDAQLIAAQSGAALLVVQENVSRLKEVETLCSSLRGVGVRLLGAALQQ
ncbi:MAG: polysaccharide biosynthesis tyrosine autokinase [Moraxellaceae bacterium]|nr:MAG: polysaccharide biosynthesis tyrosine autokinase [Moraxellaceae bacterium]